MSVRLERADIQANVLLPLSRNTFPLGHLLLLHCGAADEDGAEQARRFLRELLPQICTATLFRSKRTRRLTPAEGGGALPPPPPVAITAAFSCAGLAAFGVPQSTLQAMPPEFQQGMRARAALLHDNPQDWDPVWREEGPEGRIDLLIQLRVNVASALARAYALRGLAYDAERDKAGYHPPEIFEMARRIALGRLERRSRSLIAAARRRGLTLLRGHRRPGATHAAADAASADAAGEAAGEAADDWQRMESLPRRRAEAGDLAAAVPGSADTDPADAGALRYSEYEHFGFFDGSADPVFAGQLPAALEAEAVIGQGRLDHGVWRPLATGEFLLGYPDEAQEQAPQPPPLSFSRNGTFLVLRKLHQDVARFERAIDAQLPAFRAWLADGADGAEPARGAELESGVDMDSGVDAEAARQWLRAKLVGRWEDGTPLVVAPTPSAWQRFRAEFRQLLEAASRQEAMRPELLRFKRRFRDFRFEPQDGDGSRCPLTAHIRRSNPRDSGDPNLAEQASATERDRASSLLVNRRRLLRRGMSYGPPLDRRPGEAAVDDGAERGTLFIALCGGIARQFEFMQQQWLNHGADFGAGNDVCPISGVQPISGVEAPADPSRGSKVILAAAADSGRPPFVMRPAPDVVSCRGGGYFFLPSLTALRRIAQGLVDPL